MSSHPAAASATSCQRINILLYVQRFAECVAFYRDGLRLPQAFANAWFVEFRINEGACVSVVEKGSTRMRDQPHVPQTLTFAVADVDAAHAELREFGLAPGPVRRHGFGARVFYLDDPAGNQLEYWSPE